MLQRGLKFKKDTNVTCLFEYGQRIKTGRDILKLLDLWDSRVPMHTFPEHFCFVKGKTTTLAKAKICANLLDLFHVPLHNIEVHFQWTVSCAIIRCHIIFSNICQKELCSSVKEFVILQSRNTEHSDF